MQILQWLGLADLHPLLAWGIVGFYAVFLFWLVTALVGWRLRKGLGRVDLDREKARAPEPPDFVPENVAEKEEALAKADAYVNPEEARARAAAQAAAETAPRSRSDLLARACRLTGILVLIVGLGFVAVLVYALVARPAGERGSLLSEEAWKTVLATHWMVILFTAIRTVGALLGLRRSMAS